MSILSKFFNNEAAQTRVKICDIISTSIQSITKLEKEYIQKFSSQDLTYLRKNHNTNESKFEKAIFTLSIIYKIYNKYGISKEEFFSLVYSTYDLFANHEIREKLKKNGVRSKTDFLNSRLNFYIRELDLLTNLEHPHSGYITNYWYVNPLSLEEGVDKGFHTLTFFLSIIYPDYLKLVEDSVNKVLEN
ncbi:MAG: hypothetical protein HND52_14020 [Ignavibacteriae bacterium]|nr:hypothetical protein [Ignavibacteriota bacterium]NOG99071.1 hypothetical protein [Ignavibacteriota bacterium]